MEKPTLPPPLFRQAPSVETIDPAVGLPDDLHDDFRRMFGYWKARHHADGGLPALRDIDLMDLYDIAPRVLILDQEAATPEVAALGLPARFRWRFVGTAFRDVFGVELTGRYLDQTHPPERAEESTTAYLNALRTRGPVFWRRGVRVNDVEMPYRTYQRLAVPLNGADGRPAHILALWMLEAPNL